MFLKHRNFLRWISYALAALCLSLGWVWREMNQRYPITATTTVGMYTTTVVDGEEMTMVEAEETTAAVAETETERTTAQEAVTTQTTAAAEEEFSPEPVDTLIPTTETTMTLPQTQAGAALSGRQSWLLTYLGHTLTAIGILLGLAFVFLFPQKRPYLGPEAELALGVAAFFFYWENEYVLQAMFPLLAFRLAFVCILLVCLRGLWSWIWNRFSLGWLLPHRAGMLLSANMTRPQLYILVHGLWSMGLTALSVLMLFDEFWLEFQYWIWFSERLYWSVPVMTFAILSILSMMRYAGGTQHLCAQIRNIAAGKTVEVLPGAFEQQEQALSALQQTHEEAVKTAVTSERFKVELISNVSHDLRTPLTSILGYGELLEKEELSEQGKEQLACLNMKAGYMKELVEELFELTKVSSGLLESRRDEIDLIRLLEQTIGLADDQLTAAELSVRRHYCAEQLPVITDGTRIHQVFANLLGNAIKYALKGTRIHLTVREEDDRTVIRMSNIASYEMDFEPEEILQRFARGDKARSTQGSGLGLAIAQTYTESVGGHFHVEVDGDQFSAVVTLPKADRNL